MSAGIVAARTRHGAEQFDVPGGDLGLGFTMKVGPNTMARIEVAKGKYTIGVNAVTDDPAKAKQRGVAATALLVAAI